MAIQLNEREPAPDDDVFTPASLATQAQVTRQAIDSAIRTGKIPAYRFPGSRRIWIRGSDVPARYRLRDGIENRLRQLEAQVAELAAQASEAQPHRIPRAAIDNPDDKTAPEKPHSQLLAENATLRAINQLLLAEGADREQHDAKRREAFDHLHQALERYEEADAAISNSRARYREALMHTQWPGLLDED